MEKLRKVLLQDGTCMGDELCVFRTNAPVERLKKLEKESCEIYKNGGSYDDIPIWSDVLSDEGYVFEYVFELDAVCGDDQDDVCEKYVIENQPEI